MDETPTPGPETLFDYWMAHQDDSRAALALIETQGRVIEEARALLRSVLDECEPHTHGRPAYDATMDHLHDCAAAFLAASDPT